MQSVNRTCLPTTLLMLALALPNNALASKWTQQDIMMLPEFCQVRMRPDKSLKHPREDHWKAVLGKNMYSSLHHYCIGMIYLTRSYAATNRNQKRHYAKNAIDNLNYTLRGAPVGFPLLAEGYRLKCQAYNLMGKKDEAMKEAENLIALNRNDPRGYFLLSDLLYESGRYQDAKEVLAEAKALAPESKSIELRSKRIERKLQEQ